MIKSLLLTAAIVAPMLHANTAMNTVIVSGMIQNKSAVTNSISSRVISSEDKASQVSNHDEISNTKPASYERATTCGKIGELAVNVYDARQYNVPADEAFEAASESAIAMAIVREAYTMPRWNTEKYRNSNRVDFKSKWVLWCYDTFDGGNK